MSVEEDMIKMLKYFAGLLLIVAMGFIIFLVLTGLGFVLAIAVNFMPTWAIIGGTFVGTAMVVLHLIMIGKE